MFLVLTSLSLSLSPPQLRLLTSASLVNMSLFTALLSALGKLASKCCVELVDSADLKGGCTFFDVEHMPYSFEF